MTPSVASRLLRQVRVNDRDLEDNLVCLRDLHELLAEEGL